MPHNSVKTNILKLITLRLALVTVMLCAFSGAAFAQFCRLLKLREELPQNIQGQLLQGRLMLNTPILSKAGALQLG